MTVVGRHCRKGQHWACYGRAGGPARVADPCPCWCHDPPSGAVRVGPWHLSDIKGVLEREVDYGDGLKSTQFYGRGGA